MSSVSTKHLSALRGDDAQSRPWSASPLWWMVAIALGFIASCAISVKRDSWLGEAFNNDARTIVDIAHGQLDWQGSFRFVSNFYSALGLIERPIIAGLLGVVLCLLCALAAVKATGGVRGPIIGPAFLFGYLVLSGIYIGTFTKEIFIVVFVTAVLLMPVPSTRWKFIATEAAIIVLMLVIGVGLRKYWVFIAAAFVLFRIVTSRTLKLRYLIPVVLVVNVLFSLAIVIVAGRPADGFRYEVNETINIHLGGSNTMIYPFIDSGSETLSGVLNNLITLIVLVLPVPLLAMGGAYYIASAVLFIGMWSVTMYAVARRDFAQPVLAQRIISVLMAFIVTQGLFEPDYGSALRHLVPLIPFFFVLWSMRDRSDDEIEDFEGFTDYDDYDDYDELDGYEDYDELDDYDDYDDYDEFDDYEEFDEHHGEEEELLELLPNEFDHQAELPAQNGLQKVALPPAELESAPVPVIVLAGQQDHAVKSWKFTKL